MVSLLKFIYTGIQVTSLRFLLLMIIGMISRGKVSFSAGFPVALALETCPVTANLTILTDSLDSLTTLFHLRRADFPVSLYRHPTRQLYIHTVRLRHASGVLTRLIKVKAHAGEPLNEAADALARRRTGPP